jgi:hypothetical protein
MFMAAMKMPPVLMDGEATRTEIVQADNSREPFAGRQPEHAATGHVGKKQVATAIEARPLEYHRLVRYLEPGLRHYGLQAAL